MAKKLPPWDANLADVPAELESHEFRVAWALFVDHRLAIKKPLTPVAAALTMKKLRPLGAAGAVACLEESVCNGWQGVFPRPVIGARAPAAGARLTDLCEPFEQLWGRWRNARQVVGRSMPARAQSDLCSMERLGVECKNGGEYWHLFEAYLRDQDRWLSERGWPLEMLPSRMNKYTQALEACRARAAAPADRGPTLFDPNEPTEADIDALVIENNVPY